MTTKERYLSQVANVVKSLTEQYYMSHDEYYGIAHSLLNEIQAGYYPDDYVFGFTDALGKVGKYFDDKA